MLEGLHQIQKTKASKARVLKTKNVPTLRLLTILYKLHLYLNILYNIP